MPKQLWPTEIPVLYSTQMNNDYTIIVGFTSGRAKVLSLN